MRTAEPLPEPNDPDRSDPRPGPLPGNRSRRPYETPRLIHYGHVKQLTAGAKVGVTEGGLTSSIV